MLFRPRPLWVPSVAAIYGAAAGINLATFSEWLDISDLSTLYVERTGSPPATLASVNGVVGSVFNKGTGGGYYTAGSDAARPILRQSGSEYYLEFDGVDDYLRRSFTQSQPFSRVSAIRAGTSTANSQVLGGSSANAAALYRNSTTTLTLFSGSVLTTGVTLNTTTNAVITERHNGASSRIALDNGSYVTGNAGTTVSGGITIGASNTPNNYHALRLYGMVADNSDISDANIALIRTRMGNLIGLSL